MTTIRDHLIKWLQDLDSGIELRGHIFEVARQNPKRPAYMSFFVPDDWSLNISGNEKLADTYLVLRIPRELLDKLDTGASKEDNGSAEDGASVHEEQTN